MLKFILGFFSAFGLLAFIGNRALKNQTLYFWTVTSVSNLIEKVLFSPDKGDLHTRKCMIEKNHPKHVWTYDAETVWCEGRMP